MRTNASWDETAGALLGIAATIGFFFYMRKAWLGRHVLIQRLNTPIKRASGIVLIASAPFLVFGILQVSFESSGLLEFLSRFYQAIVSTKKWEYESFLAARYGFYGVVFGLIFSFLYDDCVDWIVRWIKFGASKKKE
jgi:hypothetical protein